jgi:hypothetical protein
MNLKFNQVSGKIVTNKYLKSQILENFNVVLCLCICLKISYSSISRKIRHEEHKFSFRNENINLT